MSLQDYPQQNEPGGVPARKDASYRGVQTFEGRIYAYGQILQRAAARTSFWTVVPLVTLMAATYFYFIADPLYVSESVISIQHKGSVGGGLSSMLGNLAGTSGSSNEDAALAEYVVSNDLLMALDKEFHLRDIYSTEPRDPFNRLSKDASQERFLRFYRKKIELDVRYDVGLLTIRVLDYNPVRAQEINQAIIGRAEAFMNSQSLAMMTSSLKFARNELSDAQAAAIKAPPLEQDVARMRLQAAQQAFANASSVAGQQQTFLTHISNPNLPTAATRPERLLDTLAAAVIASILYVVGMLGLANIRDHRGA